MNTNADVIQAITNGEHVEYLGSIAEMHGAIVIDGWVQRDDVFGTESLRVIALKGGGRHMLGDARPQSFVLVEQPTGTMSADELADALGC